MMTRELLFGIVLLFIRLRVASEDSVLPFSNTTIEGKVGDTVILPCLVGDKKEITHKRVEWFKNEKTSENDQPIHKCIWRLKATQIPREDFKNLASLFEEELSSGNFSLSLKLNPSHNGTYYCYVAGSLYCTVTIKVLPEGKNTSHSQDNNRPPKNNWTIGVIVGAVVGLVVVVVALIALGVYLYRKRRNPLSSRMKPKNQQIYHGVPVQAQQPRQDEGNNPADQNPIEEQNRLNVIVDQGN